LLKWIFFENIMQLRNLGLVILSAALAACGGGGSGSSSATLTDGTVKPSGMTAVAWSVGDTFTHKLTATTTATGETSSYANYATEVVTALQPNGGATARSVSSDSMYEDFVYDGERRLVSSSSDLGACKTEHSPGRRTLLPQPVSVGSSWDVTTKSTSVCSGTTTETQFAAKYTAVALESLTLPIGTFQALKVVGNWTSESNTSSRKGERTCWFDPELNVELKCEGTSTATSKLTGKVTNSTSAMELQGYSSAKARRQYDAVSRFAGEWSGGYSGAGLPTAVCVVNIDVSGGFKGNCGSITIGGTITADGTMSFRLSEFGLTGPTFTGKFDNPLTIKGTFSIQGGSGGTWTLVHM
jgi:hypothetical protein